MSRLLRSLPACLVVAVLPCFLVPATAAALRVEVFNTRRAITGRIWGSGPWIAFCVDEAGNSKKDARSLNSDMDTDDTVLQVFNMRTLQPAVNTGMAIDPELADGDDWPVDVSGDLMVAQVSEMDNGMKDLNNNGRADDNVLELYNLATRQWTNLGLVGKQPTLSGGQLYFVQTETDAKKDLNGDGDTADSVLCSLDVQTRQVRSLGMDAGEGYQVSGDWIATYTSEAAQGGKDLNGDKDTGDIVAQLYHIPEQKWTNTGLECSFGFQLTSKLLAVGVEEQKQGAQDLNGDGDTKDVVCEVWDLAGGKATNTEQDCSGDLAAEGNLVGIATSEKGQGNKDLNGDKDTNDQVAQCYTLGQAKPVNLARDCSGGIEAGGGRIAFSCSETDQGKRDLNGDRDTEDYVLLIYDPATNKILNSGYSVDGDLNYRDGYLAWTTLEADQGNRDLNRDGDSDDSVLFVVDVAAGQIAPTGYACTDAVCVTNTGVGFAVPEADQANRDLNMNGTKEDDVVHVARYISR